MTNLLDFTKALFGSNQMWANITREDKETHYFIINRMFAKKYPAWSSILSQDNIDKSSAMDSWHHLVRGRGYEAWFWKKNPDTKPVNKDTDLEDQISQTYDWDKQQISVVQNIYPEVWKELVAEIKKKNKQK
jgi:hypothetical protein